MKFKSSTSYSKALKMGKLSVIGSSGLIGSEVVEYFADEGWEVHGIDNNQRAKFFGPAGDARWNQQLCYISDLTKIRAQYPSWDITKS
jgi:nucleoside-diphosphate-sugar epimerase